MSTSLTNSPLQKRNVALDVFRGMTVCFMIIVNTPGNDATTFSPLHHAAWNGFTPTDLVFPSFLFAVGNAMSFVMKKWANMSQQQVVWKILKRTAIIFLLGYLMYWFPFFRLDKDHNFISCPYKPHPHYGSIAANSFMLWHCFTYDLFFESENFRYHMCSVTFSLLDYFIHVWRYRTSAKHDRAMQDINWIYG